MNKAYIENAASALKELGFVGERFRPRDDTITLERNKKSDGCYMLYDVLDRKEFVLAYNPIGQKHWVLAEGPQIYAMLLRGALDEIGLNWRESPFLFGPNESAKQLQMAEKFKNDSAVFSKDLSGSADLSHEAVKDFFSAAKTPYASIDDGGFYQVLPVTRSRFRNVPSFLRSVYVKYTAKLTGTADSYKFVLSAECKLRSKSRYAIAPRKGSSWQIDVRNIVLPQ